LTAISKTPRRRVSRCSVRDRGPLITPGDLLRRLYKFGAGRRVRPRPWARSGPRISSLMVHLWVNRARWWNGTVKDRSWGYSQQEPRQFEIRNGWPSSREKFPTAKFESRLPRLFSWWGHPSRKIFGKYTESTVLLKYLNS